MKHLIRTTIAVALVATVATLTIQRIHFPAATHAAPVPSPKPDAQATAPAGEDRPVATLRDINRAFIDISKEATPSVVTVFTEKVLQARRMGNPFSGGPFEDFFNQFFQGNPRGRSTHPRQYRQRGLGSGVVVSGDGYILTNNHVIAGADTINVRFIDDRTLPATVIGADPKTDIAVIKVDADGLTPIRLGDSDRLEVGEWVLAIGSPLSPNLAHTVTSGIVSAKGRSNVGLAEYEDFIQTDAAINPGNSGGALINLDGKLVGINSAIATQNGGFQGIGFAVPINMAQRIMDSLIKTGTVVRGWLGVYIQDVDETMAKAMELPKKGGALISDVSKGSPADKAGAKNGDVIVALDGDPVENSTRLRNDIASKAPGTKVELGVLRDGKRKTLRVELGELKANEVSPEAEQKLGKIFGFQVAPFDRDLADKYRLDNRYTGVVITQIDPSSPARRAGLDEGDLIVAVNRKRVENMEAFNRLVGSLKHGDTVLFRVVRKHRSFYAAFTL